MDEFKHKLVDILKKSMKKDELSVERLYELVDKIAPDVIEVTKEEIMKKSKLGREKFDGYKAKYTKLKADVEPKIAELKAQLAKIQKDIDSKLYQKYMQKRENRIFPVFVALTENKCGGCRMEISASKLGAMKNNEFGVIECENCGRIIYTK